LQLNNFEHISYNFTFAFISYQVEIMPIYDFKCASCGFKDELMRKSSDASTIACPQCHAEAFSKMLSAPSFQLSGSGWYATDFKDQKSKNQPQNQAKTQPENKVSEPSKVTAETPVASTKSND
jgi:putative FmdB family regulatory protein